MQKNLDVRKAIEKSSFKYWQVAEAIGISHITLSVRLRKELSKSEKEKIYAAIEQLRKEKGSHGNE